MAMTVLTFGGYSPASGANTGTSNPFQKDEREKGWKWIRRPRIQSPYSGLDVPVFNERRNISNASHDMLHAPDAKGPTFRLGGQR
jgi:hypothetical protein